MIGCRSPEAHYVTDMDSTSHTEAQPGNRRADDDVGGRKHRSRLVSLAFAAALLFVARPMPVLADVGDFDAIEEEIDSRERFLKRDIQRSEKANRNVKTLKRERSELRFRKRTKHPFRPERLLRDDIRRNELRQGAAKAESRRLDYKVRRQRRTLRRLGIRGRR